MPFDKSKRYSNPEDFFLLRGNVSMFLSPEAAIAVCARAAGRGFIVVRVEGGLWHNPKFEARLDCIWDGDDPPIDEGKAHENNLRAADFIEHQMAFHSAFVLTAPSIKGYSF